MVHNDMHGTEFRLLLKKCSDKNTEYSSTQKLFHCYVFPLAQEENNSAFLDTFRFFMHDFLLKEDI